jgi:hypothetical protein
MAPKRKYFGRKKKSDLNVFEMSSIKDYKDRFSKWHSKQIDLLTFCINLLFTLSIAVSGFIISNKSKDLFKNNAICVRFSSTQTVLFMLILSASIGVIGLIARLNDFRLTKDIIKTRRRIFELEYDIKYEDCEPSDKKFQQSRRDNLIFWTKFLGCITWICFYIQLFLFIVTIWLIVLNV